LLLLIVALDKTLHVRDARTDWRCATEDLQIHTREMMVRIGIKLSLELSEWLRRNHRIVDIGVSLRAVQAVYALVDRHERAEHVIERAVFHHKHDDVFQIVQAYRHSALNPPRSKHE
jgi:hypothetical protein